MCGGRSTTSSSASAAAAAVEEEQQFDQSKVQIDLDAADSAGAVRSELKRQAPKRRQMELPSPSNAITEAAADADRNNSAASKAPPGVFDFPMPRSGAVVFDNRQFYDVFFRSLVDGRSSLVEPIVMEGYQPFDETIMDDDMQRIWLPILRDQPLIPIVYKERHSRFF